MRSIVLPILICRLLLPLDAQAQSTGNTTDAIPHKWALQVKMPDLISDSPDLDGDVGSIYLLWGVSRHSALRMGASLALLTRTDKRTYIPRQRAIDATGILVYDTPTPVKELTLQVHYLGYAPPSGAATLYYGAGPLFSVARVHKEWNPYHWQTRTMWSLGVEGVFGFLAQIKPHIRLLVEYKISYADRFYKSTSSNDGRVRTWTYSKKVQQYVPHSAIPLVGVSFHFK